MSHTLNKYSFIFTFLFVSYIGIFQVSTTELYRDHQVDTFHNNVKIQNIFWRSEYHQGREDVSMGQYLINEGKEDRALGYEKMGREKIRTGERLKELGHKEIQDSYTKHRDEFLHHH